ncbi:MAG: hypothetical protein E7Z92_06230 [Cyanobacteria bacterium SIG31]|nr:hypothetical protein [Cyanobacteria bacterium SIG31]
MVNAISSSTFKSMVNRGTEQLMKEHNRRAIAQVFEKATYNRQGFAQATHDVARMADRYGKVQGWTFFPKLKQPGLLQKSLKFIARIITKH